MIRLLWVQFSRNFSSFTKVDCVAVVVTIDTYAQSNIIYFPLQPLLFFYFKVPFNFRLNHAICRCRLFSIWLTFFLVSHFSIFLHLITKNSFYEWWKIHTKNALKLFCLVGVYSSWLRMEKSHFIKIWLCCVIK